MDSGDLFFFLAGFKKKKNLDVDASPGSERRALDRQSNTPPPHTHTHHHPFSSLSLHRSHTHTRTKQPICIRTQRRVRSKKCRQLIQPGPRWRNVLLETGFADDATKTSPLSNPEDARELDPLGDIWWRALKGDRFTVGSLVLGFGVWTLSKGSVCVCVCVWAGVC